MKVQINIKRLDVFIGSYLLLLSLESLPISTKWDPTFEGLDPDNIEAFRLFLSTLNFQNLACIAAEVRSIQPASCRINHNIFQRGSCNVVFELLFADGVSWVARIRLPPAAWLQPTSEALQRGQDDITQSEIDTLRYLKSHTSIPVPTIFHYDLSQTENSVGAAYILMEGFDGVITPSVFSSIEPGLQDKIYRRVARVVLQLSGLSSPSIGLIRKDGDKLRQSDWFDDFGHRHSPCQSTSDYFARVYGGFLAEASHSQDPDRQAVAWLFHRCSQYIQESCSDNSSFPVCHGDLTSGNFLWDGEFNLVAVIDWSNTMTLPWELVGVIHEFYNNDSAKVRQARAHFATILAEEETESKCVARISTQFSSPLTEIMTIIRECNIPTSAAMYHVPRLLELLPCTIDVSTLDVLSNGFIERATKLRENIRKGIRTLT